MEENNKYKLSADFCEKVMLKIDKREKRLTVIKNVMYSFIAVTAIGLIFVLLDYFKIITAETVSGIFQPLLKGLIIGTEALSSYKMLIFILAAFLFLYTISSFLSNSLNKKQQVGNL